MEQEWTSKNKAVAFGTIGGLFFGMGWWIFLSAASLHHSSKDPIPFSFYLPLIGQFISFLMINLPAWSAISGDDSAAFVNPGKALCVNRGIVVAGLFLQLSCVASSVYILACLFSFISARLCFKPSIVWPASFSIASAILSMFIIQPLSNIL